MTDDKEKTSQKAEWTQTTVGGSVSCWPLTVKKSVVHPGWEDTVLRWYNWLNEMKKKDEEKKMEVEHQKIGQSHDQQCRWEDQVFCTRSPSQRRGEEVE